MKICDKREKKERPEVPERPVPGRVYQVIRGHFNGRLYLADCDGDLTNLGDGCIWCRGGGFGGYAKDFRDVTDYVCLDTSRLPPLED